MRVNTDTTLECLPEQDRKFVELIRGLTPEQLCQACRNTIAQLPANDTESIGPLTSMLTIFQEWEKNARETETLT